MSDKTDIDEMLDWVDERFLKSFAKVHCLAIISQGHSHGYDMMKFVNKEYGLKLNASAIYPLLQQLEDEGYIEGEWEQVEGKPGKKSYRITQKGIETLDAARERILSLARNLRVEKTG